jgi:hypothetical protein
MKFKLKLLHIKCHVLEFAKDKAQKMLQRIPQSFAEANISYGQAHPLRPRREWLPRTTYTCESQ